MALRPSFILEWSAMERAPCSCCGLSAGDKRWNDSADCSPTVSNFLAACKATFRQLDGNAAEGERSWCRFRIANSTSRTLQIIAGCWSLTPRGMHGAYRKPVLDAGFGQQDWLSAQAS